MGTHLTNPVLAMELAQRKAERLAEKRHRRRAEYRLKQARSLVEIKREPRQVVVFEALPSMWERLYNIDPGYYWMLHSWVLLKRDMKFITAPNISWFDIEKFRKDVGHPPGPGYKRVRRPGLMRWGKHTTLWVKLWDGKTEEEEHKFYIDFIRKEFLSIKLGAKSMSDYQVFIKEDYLLGKHVIRDVHPYGLGIVIHQKELSRAILDKKISPAILTDRNIRVVE